MNNPALIANWTRQFREGGIDGLSKTKGRPPILSKKNEIENKKQSPTKATPEESDRIKELKKQVCSLYRPQKVRPKNLTFGGRYFLWLSILLNLN